MPTSFPSPARSTLRRRSPRRSRVCAAVAAGAAAAALGVTDPLIPAIVFLAFVVLRLRYPGRWQRDQGALSTRVRLVIAGAWLTLVAYLSVVFFLTAGWLV
jgi:hypothetical protein